MFVSCEFCEISSFNVDTNSCSRAKWKFSTLCSVLYEPILYSVLYEPILYSVLYEPILYSVLYEPILYSVLYEPIFFNNIKLLHVLQYYVIIILLT
jgi:hypothetical protein